MNIGQKIVLELANGKTYCDLLSQHQEEIEKTESELQKSQLPTLFKLHTKESAIAPKSPEEFLVLLEMIDLKKSKPATFKLIFERVLGYPLSYYSVKKKVSEVLRIMSQEHITKHKKLEYSLFKCMLLLASRCTKAFSEAVICPWIQEGMTSTCALVLSRVIMKASSEKEYMEEFLVSLLDLDRTHSLYIIVTSILIKKIAFSVSALELVYAYILDARTMETRFLAWNKLVLAFVRAYKKDIDLSELLDVYNTPESKIEVEIKAELQN
ncbi:hypothetical protein NEFER03_1902 [Nematocida sp. LUAm3]|nr:hypothetical protein NEFER03_1902 [Nematocida sp. LUAm3]KAI5173947.1 hypothetical protein NEFER02_0414 [Nematocida sp. LUAm2]KAI5177308.1 hypothetical protein NEFER01_0583 [Nematocida sp. LUAm1]